MYCAAAAAVAFARKYEMERNMFLPFFVLFFWFCFLNRGDRDGRKKS
jgi:hypothetical protein